MKTGINLNTTHQQWTLSGWAPHQWRFQRNMETGSDSLAEIAPVPALVPGSVQQALLQAGVLPDWNVGLNSRLCEWVENRHWIYETVLTAKQVQHRPNQRVRLKAEGLDYCGCVLLNGREVGTFRGTFVPHEFDLTDFLAEGENRLTIVFEESPRWLGQFGYTSRMTEWKARFNYTWDWVPRLMQIGIWDQLSLVVDDENSLDALRLLADVQGGKGRLRIGGQVRGAAQSVYIVLSKERNGGIVREEVITPGEFNAGLEWCNLPVEFWRPNGTGAPVLYEVDIEARGQNGEILAKAYGQPVGFKSVVWEQCEGSPAGAEPWVCVVNGEPLFLQGVNWTPIRANFADVTVEQYKERLELYRDLGVNCVRVWGGAFLEKEIFYDLCDHFGILVWQEFPQSSSGVENWPPEDVRSLEELSEIARSYVRRRRHHACLLLWCGGNELQGALDGGKTGIGKPVDISHPLMRRFGEIVAAEDPGRRFLPTSASGPRFMADEKEFGQGLHWDVHGPWSANGDLDGDWVRYWANDDALFRSETGAPGASDAELIRQYLGDQQEVPGTLENPLWRRISWWVEWPEFVRQFGREPENLEEYVAWSQERQARALEIAFRSCKERFPRCGGFLIWMGHDSFPCAANTAIVDFHGKAKPAGRVFLEG